MGCPIKIIVRSRHSAIVISRIASFDSSFGEAPFPQAGRHRCIWVLSIRSRRRLASCTDESSTLVTSSIYQTILAIATMKTGLILASALALFAKLGATACHYNLAPCSEAQSGTTTCLCNSSGGRSDGVVRCISLYECTISCLMPRYLRSDARM